MALVKLGSVKKTDLVVSGSVNLSTDVGSSILPVANGGTGSGSFVNGQLLIGNTTGNTLTKATLTGTSNQVIVTNGSGSITLSLPQSIGTASNVTFGGITIASGGEAKFPNNGLHLSDSSESGKYLHVNCADATLSVDRVLSISVSNADRGFTISGDSAINQNVTTTGSPTFASLALTSPLSAANGGTGNTSIGTGVASALTVNLGTGGSFVTNGGVLGTPSSGTLTNCTGLPVSTGVSGLGTGVATALGVNVDSAGAFVTFNGALGTPSSGTVTNLTGTASININGTIGATTPSTGTFTTATAIAAATQDAIRLSPRSGGTGGFIANITTTTLTASRTITIPDSTGTIVLGGGTCSGACSGTNTGDQTSVSGNAGTATALQTSRTIGGSAFDGTANVTSFPSPGAIGGTTPAAGTFTNVTAIAASTQDAVKLSPRAGGTSSFVSSITTTTLTASRVITLPDATGTVVLGGGTCSGTSSGTNTGDQTITLTGEATGTGTGSFATTLTNSAVIGKVLTGFTSGAGTVAATDTILQAVQKLDGNMGWVLLSTQTASNSATIDFTTGINSTYKMYVVEWDGVKSGSTGNGLQMRISTDGGSTWKSGASDYAYSFCYFSSGATTMTVQSSTGVASMNCAVAVITTTANTSGSGTVKCFNPSDSARFFTIETSASVTNTSTSVWASRGVGNYTTAGAVNGFRFLMQSGNIVSGTFRLYGVR